MKTLLLVEGEPIVRNLLKQQQLAGHYDLLQVSSPAEAIEICQSHRDIDVLICDAEMGLISGMELASLLRAWISRLHIILTSDLGYDLWTERERCEFNALPSDAVIIIQKPFTARDLKSAITRLMPEAIEAVA